MNQTVWNIILALGGGVLIGICFLMQVVLRDTYGDQRNPVSSGTRWGGILMRLVAAVFALLVIVIVGRHISRVQDFTIANVIAALLGLVVCFRAGRTIAEKIARSARSRL